VSAIDIEKAKSALSEMVDDKNFLKEYPSFAPLKEYLQEGK
jgi:hypothetical protein